MKILLTYPFRPTIVQEILGPLKAEISILKKPSELPRRIAEADALICLLTDAIDAKLLKKAKKLKVIGNHAVGINNIDLDACRKRGIQICNTPNVLNRSTAELTLALLFATARRFYEGEKLCRQNRFKGWTPELLLGQELKSRHAVLVGKGRIGQETAKLFQAVGLTTEFITRQDAEATIRKKLRRAQVLSFHCPLTPQTQHWLNARRLRELPRDSIVLNTSRGPVIDEKALIQALIQKKIFAAGLDVFEAEPRIPARLRRLPNCVLLPHLGSATKEARTAMLRLVLTGVRDLLLGKNPKNKVIF